MGVSGRKIDLSHGGSVWLSNGPVKTEIGESGRGILFINKEGLETKICLSEEALFALSCLLNESVNNLAFKHEVARWKQVCISPTLPVQGKG